jgi:hypothetical protein
MRPSANPTGSRRIVRIVTAAIVIAIALVAQSAYAAEPPALAKARALYNAADYDGAIAAAVQARTQPGTADAAALVEARAHLERYRQSADSADLGAARDALSAIHSSALMPRDQLDFLVGLGQSLYFGELFGSAAELFDTALERGAFLPARDRMMLLDWWATALDREAQASAPDRRMRLYEEMTARMGEELRRDPGSAPANYWRAVAARGVGDIDAAWDAAVAAWVRAPLDSATSVWLRSDIDHLVTQAIIPERARTRPAREQVDATETFRSQWESVKQQWK